MRSIEKSFSVVNDDIKFCDPWEARDFVTFMGIVPDKRCGHCLPDCSETLYNTAISSAPILKCDHTNIGSSEFCQFSLKNNLNPPPWAFEMSHEFNKTTGEMPEFFQQSGIFQSQRKTVMDSKLKRLILKEPVIEHPTYDAYEKDIAIVDFYFKSATMLQYQRQHRMTLIAFIGQLGGTLGLFMGLSVISVIEFFYWILFKGPRSSKTIGNGNRDHATSSKRGRSERFTT